MIRLNGAAETLEIAASAAGSLDWYAAYETLSATDMAPDAAEGNLAAASTITIVAGAADPVQTRALIIFNAGSAPNQVTVKKDISGTERILHRATLQAGETLQYSSNAGFSVLDKGSRIKTAQPDAAGIIGRRIPVIKVGTAAEGIGILHCLGLASGSPGAWSPGAPGLNGRATDGLSAADAGCIKLWTPTGTLYLVDTVMPSSVAATHEIYDLLWVNTGLVVTTLTAQAITSAALPARDFNDTANGEAVIWGLLVTSGTTNAANVTNITASYTNQSGVAGRAATMASFPLTANSGTFVPFQFQSGDTGARSFESVTFGTSLVTGSVSLCAMTFKDSASCISAGLGMPSGPKKTGVKLLANACLLPFYLPNSTTALNTFGSIEVEDR
jgi:hypothetical protein